MLDVAEGEAAGGRLGWRSLLMSWGTQRFKELCRNQKEKLARFITFTIQSN